MRGLDSDTSLNADSFYQIKSAIRHATFEPECHSDIPKLIQSLQRFKEDPRSRIARRAFYEEFVAALRGLNAAEGYEEQVLDYLSTIGELSETDELEQASNLLGYAAGATARGILKIPETTLAAVHSELLERVITITPQRPSFVRCACLFIRGFIEFKSSYIDPSSGDEALETLREAVKNSVHTWTLLLEEIEEVCIFPIERLSSTVDFLFPIVDEDWFEAFTTKLDTLIAKRNGSERMAETLLGRGSALLDQKQHFRALNIFHEALDGAQEARSQRTAVIISLQLAELYLHLRLYHAAKYYALSAAFAAISLKDDELKELAAVGLAVACEADYASGSSMLFFLTYQMFVGFAMEYRLAGTEAYKQKKWGTVDYYATLLTRASMLLGPDVHTECLEIIKKVGLYEEYTSHEDQLDKLFERYEGNLTMLARDYSREEAAAPFSDLEVERQTAWRQEGIEWHISWPTVYQAERLGSAFCAVVQIALASMHKSEFTLAATKVRIRISVDEGKIALRQQPNNEILEFALNLSYQNDLSLSEATWSIFQILKIASAMPDDQFDQQFMERFRDDVPQRCGTYVSPSGAFREFYSQDSYAHLQSVGRDQRNLPVTTIETHSDVPGGDLSPHPEFDAKEAEEQITRRYERITALYPFTIAQLSSTPTFQSVLIKLREQGWRDWHVLQAIASIRVNDLGHRAFDQDSALMHYAQNGEAAADPPTPLEMFTERSMRRGLQMTQLQTLTNLGLRMKHMTPNLTGIDRLLRRFRYWELDVPHEDPFKIVLEEPNLKPE
jgi:tetratricopeptide (TPR) repeat protein